MGCANQNSDTGSKSGESVAAEETVSVFHSASDEELVEAVIRSEALHAWGLMGSVLPRSAEGIKILMNKCPEYQELWLRDSGLQTLKELGPQIVETYSKYEDSYYRMNAWFMKDLLMYMFPGVQIELETE